MRTALLIGALFVAACGGQATRPAEDPTSVTLLDNAPLLAVNDAPPATPAAATSSIEDPNAVPRRRADGTEPGIAKSTKPGTVGAK